MKKSLEITNRQFKSIIQTKNTQFPQLNFLRPNMAFYQQQQNLLYHQQLFNSQLFNSQQQNKLNFDSMGAGEAMCSRTELNSNEFQVPTEIPFIFQMVNFFL